MIRSRLIGLLVSLAPLCAHAGPVQAKCSNVEGDAIIDMASLAARPFNIPGRADVCTKGFELIEQPKASIAYLLAAPFELGLRVRRQVFRLDCITGKSILVGELPASAERMGDLSFVDTFQQGGSIFQDNYSIDASSIRRDTTSLELMFDGAICRDANDGYCRPEISTCVDCRDLARATRLKPICISHSAGVAALILPISHCKDLMAYMD